MSQQEQEGQGKESEDVQTFSSKDFNLVNITHACHGNPINPSQGFGNISFLICISKFLILWSLCYGQVDYQIGAVRQSLSNSESESGSDSDFDGKLFPTLVLGKSSEFSENFTLLVDCMLNRGWK